MRACQNIKETGYTYDANGSQITKTTDEKTETNAYNSVNQLVGFTDGETTASYTYNADGLRASKTVDGDTTRHVWDGAKQVIADVKNGAFYEADCYIRGTSLVAKYNYVNGAKSEYTYYTQNAHGDVVNLTDIDGIVIKTYKYDAFGVEKNIDDADTNTFRYCGEYYDKETATIYLRARRYNPSNGRFTQRDSFAGKQGDPLSLNLYTYCHNNPIRYIDPTGHNVFKKWHNFWEGFGSYQYDISQGKEDNIFDTYYKTGGDLYEAKESVVQTTKNIAKANAVINKGIINKVQAYESQKTK